MDRRSDSSLARRTLFKQYVTTPTIINTIPFDRYMKSAISLFDRGMSSYTRDNGIIMNYFKLKSKKIRPINSILYIRFDECIYF